jgi:hypothetical protein
VARRRSTPVAARPAPFTPDQVAAIVAGEADEREIARVLGAHKQPRLPAPAAPRRGTRATPAPIAVTAADLRELATGAVPDHLVEALDAASKRRRSAARPAKHTLRPKKRPPL